MQNIVTKNINKWQYSLSTRGKNYIKVILEAISNLIISVIINEEMLHISQQEKKNILMNLNKI